MPVPIEDIPYLRSQGYTDEEIANLSPLPQPSNNVSVPSTIGRTLQAHAGGIAGGAAAIPGTVYGAELGLLGGPAAPITVPLGAVIGGVGAGLLGSIYWSICSRSNPWTTTSTSIRISSSTGSRTTSNSQCGN